MWQEEVDRLIDEFKRRGPVAYLLRTVLGLVFFAVPAWVLSVYLMSLTQGALWVPLEWRRVILSIGFLGGLGCFSYARLRVRSRFPAKGLAPREGSSAAAMSELEAKERAVQRKRFAVRRSLFWVVPIVVLICVFATLQAVCVLEWRPSETAAQNVFCDQTKEGDNDCSFAEARERGSAYMEYVGGEYVGSILVPLGFPWAEETRSLLAQTYAFYGSPAHSSKLQVAMDYNASDLIDVIQSAEKLPLGLTQSLFVVVHVLLLLSVSTSYGYSYSRMEDTIAHFLEPSP